MSLTLLVGPSCGVGKSTLCFYLKDTKEDIVIFKTNTTRKMRPEEKKLAEEKQQYHFRSREEFEKLIEESKFFEYEVVTSELYGVLKEDLRKAIKAKDKYIGVVDIRGAINIKKAYPQVTTIFILPPSFEIAKERFLSRKGSSQEFIKARLKLAFEEEIHRQDETDYKVVNVVVEKAAEKIYDIMRKNS